MKPKTRVVDFILDGLSVEEADCVFVDDQIKNIRGGKACGMVTVPFDVTRPKPIFARALTLLFGTSEPSHD